VVCCAKAEAPARTVRLKVETSSVLVFMSRTP
jgi:hypothetical protein